MKIIRHCNTIVQLGILFFIAWTFFRQSDFNRKQVEFNLNLIKPWIYPRPEQEIKISNDSIYVKFKCQNLGKTPAFDFDFISFASYDKDFVTDTFHLGDNEIKRGFIFPNEKVKADYTVLPIVINLHKQKISGDSILQKIKHKKLFVHCYVTYTAFGDYQQFFRCIYSMEYIKGDKNCFTCDWGLLQASKDPFYIIE